MPARKVFEEVCGEGKGAPADNVLLLPVAYSFHVAGAAWQARCRYFEGDFPGGVLFGAWEPDTGVWCAAAVACMLRHNSAMLWLARTRGAR